MKYEHLKCLPSQAVSCFMLWRFLSRLPSISASTQPPCPAPVVLNTSRHQARHHNNGTESGHWNGLTRRRATRQGSAHKTLPDGITGCRGNQPPAPSMSLPLVHLWGGRERFQADTMCCSPLKLVPWGHKDPRAVGWPRPHQGHIGVCQIRPDRCQFELEHAGCTLLIACFPDHALYTLMDIDMELYIHLSFTNDLCDYSVMLIYSGCLSLYNAVRE